MIRLAEIVPKFELGQLVCHKHAMDRLVLEYLAERSDYRCIDVTCKGKAAKG